jgi:hypothetical protein
LHLVYQRHHLPPHEVYNLPKKQKNFMYASDLLALEEEKAEADRMKRK